MIKLRFQVTLISQKKLDSGCKLSYILFQSSSMNSYVQTCTGLYLKKESGPSVGKCPNTKTFGKYPNTKTLPLIFLRMAAMNCIIFFNKNCIT